MDDFEGMTRIDCHYYAFHGTIDRAPAWRHIHTIEGQLAIGGIRLDGEWFRRSVRNDAGEVVPVIGVWQPDCDVTTIISPCEFLDKQLLEDQIHGPVLPEQLREEEWLVQEV